MRRTRAQLTLAAGILGLLVPVTAPADSTVAATAPTLTIANGFVVEGNEGQAPMTFTLSLSAPSDTPIVVSLAVEDITASAGRDYVDGDGTVTIPAGETTATFTVNVIGDTHRDGEETFRVTATSNDVEVVGGSAIGTIINDDGEPSPKPLITIEDVTVVEGTGAVPEHRIRVSLSNAHDEYVFVDFALEHGTAGPSDVAVLLSGGGQLMFEPGETTRTITILTAGDSDDEVDETAFIRLSDPIEAIVGDDSGRITVADDDEPIVTIGSASVTEGDTGTQTVSVPVTLTTPATEVVIVEIDTVALTATGDGDYVHIERVTVQFQAGEQTKTVTAQIIGDTDDEENEQFRLGIAGLAGARMTPESEGVITIVDDDDPPVVPNVSIEDHTVDEGNSGTQHVVFRVSLDRATTVATFVTVRLTPDTADAGDVDFFEPILLRFEPGETEKFVTVDVHGDTFPEGDERALVTLSDPEGLAIADTLGELKIRNDDGSLWTFAGGTLAVNANGSDGIAVACDTNGNVILNDEPLEPELPCDTVEDAVIIGSPADEVIRLERNGFNSDLDCNISTDDGDDTVEIVGTSGPDGIAVSGIQVQRRGFLHFVNGGDCEITGNGRIGLFIDGDPEGAAADDEFTIESNGVDGILVNGRGGNDRYELRLGPETENVEIEDGEGAADELHLRGDDDVDDEFTFGSGCTLDLNGSSFDCQASGINSIFAYGDVTGNGASADRFTFEAGAFANARTNVWASGGGGHDEAAFASCDDDFADGTATCGGANVSLTEVESCVVAGQATECGDASFPVVSVEDQTVVEGDSGTRQVVFRISLDRPSTVPTFVTVRLTPDTADSGDVEFAEPELFRFEPGETEKFFTVRVHGDTTGEPDERAFVTLSDPEGLTLGSTLGDLVIQNDDRPLFTPIGAMVDLPGCRSNVLGANDDGSASNVAMGITINYYGTTYETTNVNNNGNITFESPMSTFTPFVLSANTPPIIAPFFVDVDTRPLGSGLVTYGQTSFNGHDAFCVNWPGVGTYNMNTSALNSFQLLLVERDDAGPGNFDMIFNYGSLNIDRGSASGVSAGAGYSAGDGDEAHFFQFPGSLVTGALLDANAGTGLVNNSRGTLANGRYVFEVRNGDAPAGGDLAGAVTGNGSPLANAAVQACRVNGRCFSRFTSSSGNYSFAGIPEGSYNVTAFPPSGSSLFSDTDGPVEVAAGDPATLNLALTGPQVPPAGTTFGNSSPGSVPVVVVGRPARLQTSGCDGGAATFLITGQYGGSFSGTLPEVSPGVYAADVAIPFTGPAITRITIAGCPPVEFNIYIDPSGFVRTTSGSPIAGATVTLYRSDDPTGPFTVVPNGSAIMSPSNRTNPDTTDSTGHFGWDVIAGYYKVVASKSGCTGAESHVMTIPPPVTDLDIRLDCGGGGTSPTTSGGSGGSESAPTPAPPTVVPPPAGPVPPVTPPAPNAAPRLARVGGSLAPPLRARRGAVASVATGFTIDEPAKLTVEVRDVRTGRRIAILRGSRVAGARTGMRRFAIPFGVDAARTVQLQLRFALRDVRRGRLYRIVVVATDAEGARAVLPIPFRG